MKRYLWFIGFVFVAVFCAKAQNDTVVFSASGGFYEDVFSLELYNYYPQNHIRYTTNGNRPTAQSPLYEEALVLNQQLYSKSNIYTIVNCPEQDFYLPDSVQHCIVVRAAVFDENDSCISQVMTNSYFIRTLGCDTHGLPAVSICADSLDLFDFETGILVPGIYYDSLDPDWTGNYYQEGREWERLMNVEFYELDNIGINQIAGLRTHGGNGRRFQQKCLKIYAREEYGNKRFKHGFFETIPQNNFKHLVLKPYVASWNMSGVNDHICNQIASQLNMEALASRPVVTFLNGEYWGIYYIHERPDERYLEDHFGVDIDQVNIISSWNADTACGTNEHFLEFFHWMENADLKTSDAYAFVKTRMDVANFIDNQIFELFSENTDWPANNMRCWQLGDGKLRWFFYDGDACLYWNTFNAFENSVYVGDEWWPSSTQSTLFFRKLLENDDFCHEFYYRFHELLNTVFSYSNTGPMFETIKNTLASEIPFQSARFGCPNSVSDWYTNMGITQWFLMKRCESVFPVLDEFLRWSLFENTQALLKVFPNPSSGEIHVCIDTDQHDADEIAIYDLTGRKVFAYAIDVAEGQNEIVIHPNLEGGVYFMRIDDHAIKIIRY